MTFRYRTCLAALLAAASLTCTAGAQAASLPDAALDWGREGLTIPPAQVINAHTPRTAQLLGAAYHNEKTLVWKRAQYVAELGLVQMKAGVPYIVEAIADPSPLVRSEAARAAGMINDPSLLAEVQTLLRDESPLVRREAVLACAKLARAFNRPSPAINQGLEDSDAQVVAAALEAAWTAQHARDIARQVESLPDDLKAPAAEALGRLKAADQAEALLPLLSGSVAQRCTAVRALGAMAAGSQRGAVLRMLEDPHPTVRREAVAAMPHVAEPAVRDGRAIAMLHDSDPTVRETAARVLTPFPSMQALLPLTAQLDHGYAPLHHAAREALVHPGSEELSAAVIDRAAEMLSHDNPRRREDASYLLGRLRSDAAFDRHVELLRWDSVDVNANDWMLVAQAAESAGLIGDGRAVEPLLKLVEASPDALTGMELAQRLAMSQAMSNALVALARLQHRPALGQAARILDLDPQGAAPPSLRAAAAFAVGVLGEAGRVPQGVNLIAIYDSVYEGPQTKFEALKALGNLRHKSSLSALQGIAQSSPSPEMRWIAHWSYERTAGTSATYHPPTVLHLPPVSISDISR
jgi:HEAT repeat protein